MRIVFPGVLCGCMVCFAFEALLGCVSLGEKEPQSKLSYLNGDEYKASAVTAGGVPVVPLTYGRKSNATTVSGFLREAAVNSVFSKKMRFETVTLSRNGAVLMRTTTDEKGAFLFRGDIPNDTYVISIDSQVFKGTKTIDVRGYEIGNVDFPVSRR
jgi:hypothetical protein